MKRVLLILMLFLADIMSYEAQAQKITDSAYRTVAHIKSDGTIQDASYRTIGHANGIPMKWAAFYFFFSK